MDAIKNISGGYLRDLVGTLQRVAVCSWKISLCMPYKIHKIVGTTRKRGIPTHGARLAASWFSFLDLGRDIALGFSIMHL